MIDIASRLFGPWVRRSTAHASCRRRSPASSARCWSCRRASRFATLAGLPPEYGLATAIVPLHRWRRCSARAWHVVSGPTNMISLALFATLAPLGAGRLAGLHPARARRDAAGRADAVADRRAAARRARELHLAGGAARLHQRRRRADRRCTACRTCSASRAASTGSARCCRRWSRICPSSSIPTAAVAAFTIAATLILRRTWPTRAADADRLVGGARRWPPPSTAGGPARPTWRRGRRARQRARGLAALPAGRRSIRRELPDLMWHRLRADDRHPGAVDLDRQGGGRALRAAHRRQPRVSRPGPVEHRRRLRLVATCPAARSTARCRTTRPARARRWRRCSPRAGCSCWSR